MMDMLPGIGPIVFMMGFYIVTQMVSLLTRKGQREESQSVKIFAVMTILVTGLIIIIIVGSYLKAQMAPFMPR